MAPVPRHPRERYPLSSFHVDDARLLPGPAWLQARRVAAAEQVSMMPMPTADEEVWRYSRIGELDLDRFHPVAAEPAGEPAGDGGRGARWADEHVPHRSATVVVADGRIVSVDVAAPWAAKGLVAARVAELDEREGTAALDATGPGYVDLFAALNDSFTVDPALVRVPAGLRVDEPVVVVNVFSDPAAAVFPRLVVQLGEDSEANVVDVAVSEPGAAAFVAPVVQLDVGRAARLGFVGIQDLALDTWHIGSQVSQVGAEATLVSANAGLGGDYARQRTDCRLAGRGSTGNLLAVYFGEGEQTLDFRTFQDHAAPDTTSNLLFKGAVGGHSRSVYTGLIRVRKNARGTNAFQTNRNIKLSDHAWAESVPNLEIENNEVKCSHASAVGPIDEEQRFYLESRGVPPEVASRLVVTGFFDEVLGQLPVPAVIPSLRAAVSGKLARRDA